MQIRQSYAMSLTQSFQRIHSPARKTWRLWLPLVCLVLCIGGPLQSQRGGKKAPREGKELLKNPGFESALDRRPSAHWEQGGRASKDVTFLWDKKTKRSGKASASLSSKRAVGVKGAYFVQKIIDVPENAVLMIQGYVKTASGGKAWVWIDCNQGTGPGGWFDYATPDPRESWIMQKKEWTRVWCRLVPPKGTSVVEIRLMLFGRGKAWFDDFSATVVGKEEARPYPAKMKGPGIAYAAGSYLVYGRAKGGKSIYTTPIPAAFEQQVPFSLDVIVTPPKFLSKYSIKERQGQGGNLLLEVEFTPIGKDEYVHLEWKASVLLADRKYDSFPRSAPIPKTKDIPVEFRKWLASTKSVQSDNREILEKAKDIRGNSKNMLEVAEATLKFHQKVIRGLRGARSCSAVDTLHGGGACTSFANLTAAILRANGIPARVMANYPTWGQAYATHYNVEFYVPQHGWYWIDTIVGKMPIKPYEQVVATAVYPEDEDRSFEAGRNAAGGVPWGTLIQPIRAGRTGVTGALDRRGSQTVAGPLCEFEDGTKEQWRKASELSKGVWKHFLDRKLKGKEIPGAIALQRDAAESRSLKEFMATMKKARLLYKKQ